MPQLGGGRGGAGGGGGGVGAGGGGGGRFPNNYGEKEKKVLMDKFPYILASFKIGCICSDFRNENFTNFPGFFPWTPQVSFGQDGPPKTNCPSYGTVNR